LDSLAHLFPAMSSPRFVVSSRIMHRSHRRDPGAALVIVLACIVLLSGLVLAFLAKSLVETRVSSGSAEEAAATLLARGAVDSVIGELEQEITAGSTAFYPPGSDVRDPNCFYLPVTNQAMVPYRMDPGAPANVLKRSAYNSPFYLGTLYNAAWPAPEWAVNYSTTNADTSGRVISMARWNAPLLMPTQNPSDTNLTPVSTFIAPDWIYITRTAGPSAAWNADLVPNTVAGALNGNEVVARYAYVVYDEGGLLDANASGYSPTQFSSPPRLKISEACADLTQIGLQDSDITALVAWRNPTNASSATKYSNYIYTPYTNAFLTPSTGDRMFTSRQQLIAFLTQYVANNNTAALARVQGALPYLTHFSRELDAPSWFPQTNISVSGFSSYPYFNNSTNVSSTTTNRFAPLARATAAFTDNVDSLVALKNQPVAFARFPLSRLSWLGAFGLANGATAAQVLQSFGLQWDSTYCAWKYLGSSGSSSVQSSIETLDQVAQEATPREPNFFELLKAGILSGSVGMYPSPDSMPFNVTDPRYVAGPDQHIVQIGLGIMDQVNTSPLPCRIEFSANTATSALYGSKNIPYIYKMAFAPFRPAANVSMFEAWLEPVLWDPYVTGATTTSTLSLSLQLTNGTACAWPIYLNPPVPFTTNYFHYVTAPAYGTSTNIAPITIKDRIGGSLEHLTAPTFLYSLYQSPITVQLTGENVTVADSSHPYDTYCGFWLGNINYPLPPTTNEPYSEGSYNNWCAPAFTTTGSSPAAAQFTMTALYGGTNSQEVQRMNFGPYASGVWATDSSQFTTVGRRFDYFTFPDPRTTRFGFNVTQFSGFDVNTYLYTLPSIPLNSATQAPNETASGTWTTFWSPTQCFTNLVEGLPTPNTTMGQNYGTVGWGTEGSTFRWADNSSPASGGTGSPAYTDSDGSYRSGDGWWNSQSANTIPERGDVTTYRPVLLERNLYSVGELGYAFRDTPWRSLNFSSTNSPDAGLLDFFSINDGYAGNTNAPIVGGVLDLNTPHPQVLQAMLNGAARSQLNSAFDVSAQDATNMANTITTITASLPLLNKSEIATRLTPNDPTVQTTATSEPGIDTNIKERREVITRALASAGQVRTWNLMIDVIAQTGHLPPNATYFNNFVVTAEQRCWAHVAIDRYTGQIVSMQLEPVNQ
jgi:Tfp pilus assembly protein PilX